MLHLSVHHEELCCLVEEDVPALLLAAPILFGVVRVLRAPVIKLRGEGQKERVALHLDLQIALDRLWAFKGHTTRSQTHSQLVGDDVIHVCAVHNLPLVAFVIWGKHHSFNSETQKTLETLCFSLQADCE